MFSLYNYLCVIIFLQAIEDTRSGLESGRFSLNPYHTSVDLDLQFRMDFYDLGSSKESRPFVSCHAGLSSKYDLGSFRVVDVCLLQFECLSVRPTPLVPDQIILTNAEMLLWEECVGVCLECLCVVKPNGRSKKQIMSDYFQLQMSRFQTDVPKFEALTVSNLFASLVFTYVHGF